MTIKNLIYFNESNQMVFNQIDKVLLSVTEIISEYKIDVLVVGGGGSGGGSLGGGGGAGGFIYVTGRTTNPNTFNIIVGNGGIGNAGNGTNGENSIFDDLIAYGGGSGGSRFQSPNGGNGASGGGTDDYRGGTPGTGILGQGFGGGNGQEWGGGGGGGASESGYDGLLYTYGGKGGDGKPCSITGTELYYAGGGGGAAYPGPDNYGLGGLGGGGRGGAGSSSELGENGLPNTGGGGGGSAFPNGISANGGSGVVIIRYKTSDFGISTGGIKTVDGEYTIHTFTESGILNLNGL